MKSLLVSSLLFLGFEAQTQVTKQNSPSSLPAPGVNFTENKGQVSDQHFISRRDVLFGGSTKGMAFHLLRQGISYQLSASAHSQALTAGSHIKRKWANKLKTSEHSSLYRIDISWLNSNNSVQVVPDEELPGSSNFYGQNCPQGIFGVKTYKGVTYRNLYDRIDLHYYESAGGLKYDFIVAPGADYKSISLQVNGSTGITLQKNGSLLISTPLGTIEEGAPLVFQNGKTLSAAWVLKENVLSFDIQGVDLHQTLIIDPTTRMWGTYYGGAGDEGAFCVSTDGSGNVFFGGATESATGTLIATSGSYQNTFGGGTYDSFLAKFSGSGSRLWATYYGGSGDEVILSCANNNAGDIFISGISDGGSTTVLSSPGAHQQTFGGGVEDAFIAKFDAAGVRLWSTYYGGSGDDGGIACTTDLSGNVYISGYTDTNTGTVIATASSHQSAAGGSMDAFVVKFSGTGTRLWGSYYGGSGDDWSNTCTTNAGGDVFVAGGSDSNSGIATPGSHQTSFAGGTADAFVVKFDAMGVRQWATYYGGTTYDDIYSIKVNAMGEAVVCGDTDSNGGISTLGSHQSIYASGTGDAFLVKLSAAGVRLWGSYYGGNAYDDSYGLTLDMSGNIYLTGTTETNGGTSIATPGNYQSTFSGGLNADVFLVKFDAAGLRQWGTYFGGTGYEEAYCATDIAGDIYLTGYTETSTGTLIASPGSFQPSFSGGSVDAFLVKFSSCTVPLPPVNTTPFNKSNICGGGSSTLTVNGAGNILWYTAATGGTVSGSGSSFVTPSLSVGSYTWFAESNECAISASRTAVTLTVHELPVVTLISTSSVICVGESATLTASGANNYTWSTPATGFAAIITPTGSATYTVIGTASTSCKNSATVSVQVDACTGLNSLNSDSPRLRIFPNPNKGKLSVESTSFSSIKILNVLGETIYSGYLWPGLNEIVLTAAPGIYFVQAGPENRLTTLRIIKE